MVFYRQTPYETRYVNIMDKAAKAGEDPISALTATLAPLTLRDPQRATKLRELAEAGYRRRCENRLKAASILRGECQICCRPIGYEVGVLAHHGYTRRQGWQTPSCFGARHIPYSEGCDALIGYIDWVRGMRAQRLQSVYNWLTDPPATVTRVITFSPYKSVEFARPPEFDAEQTMTSFSRFDADYNVEFRSTVRGWQREAQDMLSEIRRCQKRLDAWRPPE